MNFWFIRMSFILLSGVLGSQLADPMSPRSIVLGILYGLSAGIGLVALEAFIHRIGRVSVRGFSAAVFGLLFGIIMAKLVSDAIALMPLEAGVVASIRVALTWAFCYLGMAMALRGRDEFSVIIPYVRLVRHDRAEESHVVDTSAIIDGRLLDVCKARFLEGRLMVPAFILKELQAVADSADSIKRSRGRRGLEVLKQLQSLTTVDVRIEEEDFPAIRDIDEKVVKLAQIMGTHIITCDYNLNKVAELQQVSVLNINELAQALRPVVLPGEMLDIRPMKEGKEHHQAVAYLDDGTMVVVENGRAFIGQPIRGVVTSVLQTAAGRMVFVRPDNAVAKNSGVSSSKSQISSPT